MTAGTEVRSETTPKRRAPGVSARSLTIAFLLVPLNVLFLVKGLWLWAGVTGAESLFTNAVGSLFLLALANSWLQRRRPAWAFSAGEMLTIYLVLCISTGLVCSVWDVGGAIYIYTTHAFWFATDQNRWRELIWPNLPTWLTVQDREVLAGLYQGLTIPYQAWILRAWAVPAFWWTCLVTAIMWVCLCLSSILRRRWADEEKLAFPMTVLPVHLADQRFALFRTRLFWLGAAVAGGIAAWNTLATYVPAVPSVPTQWSYGTLIENNRPWNFLRFYTIMWSPWYLGLTYLIPLDLAFSLFVFGLLWSAEYVVSGHLGWCVNKWSGFPYGEQQTAGGFLALALVAIWLDRRFLAKVVRHACGLGERIAGEEEEGLSYRTATIGLIGGLAFLWWLLERTGMPTWVVGAFLANYFLMCVVICRVRAQLGAPSHQLYGAMPNWVLPTVAGSRALGPRAMGMFYLLRPLLEEQRNHPAPQHLEGFKMAEGGRMERRRLAAAMAVVPVLALLSYFWATLHVGYRMGMASGQTHVYNILIGTWGTNELRSILDGPSHTDWSASLAILVAVCVTSVLYYLKLRFVGWPLHPVAFPISMSNTIAAISPALFATWLVKGLLLRYGGLRAHRTALPLFLGFIVGDATVSLIREVISALLGVRTQ